MQNIPVTEHETSVVGFGQHTSGTRSTDLAISISVMTIIIPHALQQKGMNTSTCITANRDSYIYIYNCIAANRNKHIQEGNNMVATLRHPHAPQQTGKIHSHIPLTLQQIGTKYSGRLTKWLPHSWIHMRHKKQEQIHNIPLALQKIRTNIFRKVEKITAMLLDPHHQSKQEQIHYIYDLHYSKKEQLHSERLQNGCHTPAFSSPV